MTAIEQLTEAIGAIVRDAARAAANEALAKLQASMPTPDRVVKVGDLVESHPGLSTGMLYKQIQRREENGLLASGALINTRGRWRIHERRYLEWLESGCDR